MKTKFMKIDIFKKQNFCSKFLNIKVIKIQDFNINFPKTKNLTIK